MNVETATPAPWTNDPAQQEICLNALAARIRRESKYMVNTYHVGLDFEDVASVVQLKILEQMHKKETHEAFAQDSPEKAADCLLATYRIRELARSIVRKEKRAQVRQAEAFANVDAVDVPHDSLAKLVAAVKSLPEIASEVPELTAKETKMFVMEGARQVLEDYPENVRDQATQNLEIPSAELLRYFKDHDENGRVSEKDRKAWYRARDKVKKGMSRAKFLSLLVIVFVLAMSLGLCIVGYRGRSMHQDDFVDQGCFEHQTELAHQKNFIKEDALDHQGDKLGHQGDKEEQEV